MNNILEVKNITKTYPTYKLDNISFSLPAGAIMGLIGANGAGKTTTIKAILDLINLENGDVKIFNKTNKSLTKLEKSDIGVVFDTPSIFPCFKVKDINDVMKNIQPNWDEKLFFTYIEKFGINHKVRFKSCSRGMQMKTSIAIALSAKPKLLILDEATSGLDPVVRNEVLEILQEFVLNEEHSVLISSHIVTDLEKVADYITYINAGKIVFSDETNNILNTFGIFKVTKADFSQIDKNDYIAAIKNDFGIHLLVNSHTISKKYNFGILDNADLEDIMVFYSKGEF